MSSSLIETRLDSLSTLFTGAKGYFFTVLLLLSVFILRDKYPADPDLFARLSVGRLVISEGHVPQIDRFAFSPKKQLWIDHEWLSGVVFYKVYHLAGEGGLILLQIVIVTLIVFFLISAQRIWSDKIGIPELLFSVVLIGDASYLWGSTIRSHLFTYLALSYFFYAIVLLEKKNKSILLLNMPLVMIFWCNAHGGFVVGLGFFGVYLIKCLLSKNSNAIFVLTVFLLTISATAINPYGALKYWQFIIDAVTMERPSITEWRSVPPNSLINLIPYLIALIAIVSFITKQNRQLWILVFCLLSFYAGISHERLLAIFYFVICVFFVSSIRIIAINKVNSAILIRSASIVLISGIVLLSIRAVYKMTLLSDKRLEYEGYPVDALNWLSNKATGGDLLVDFNNGSYAIWRLYPNFLVSLDGRYEEVYPDETLSLVDLSLNCNAPGWRSAIERLKPDYVLVPSGHKCWQSNTMYLNIYLDDTWSIYQSKLINN